MRHYNIDIAGYNIRFESGPDGPELVPADRFRNNIVDGGIPSVTIRVRSGAFTLPAEARCLFSAPYVEELKGVLFQNLENFWSIWRAGGDLYIKTVFPMLSVDTGAVLRFSLSSREWELWLESASWLTGSGRDPLEYPLDGLVLYYLTVLSGDIMIHASGVNHKGRGYIFSGVSGRGKSTIASLWEAEGAEVIHDDRLIIRKDGAGYIMHNTPVYVYDPPRSAPLHGLYLIEHGNDNASSSVEGAAAAVLVMANCVQQNWGHETIAPLLSAVTDLVSLLPVKRLSFRPDRSVVEHILGDEGKV